MKVLLINHIYNSGSTGFILRDIKNHFQNNKEIELSIATGNYNEVKENVFVFNSCRRMKFFRRLSQLGWPMYCGSWIATRKLIQYIKESKFDVVHLHCLNGSCLNLYQLLRYLAKSNIKTVVTNHAEFYYTGSCGYSYDCYQFITNQCSNCQNKKDATGAYIFGNTNWNWRRMKSMFDLFNPQNIIFTSVSPWVEKRFKSSPIVQGLDCITVMNGLETSVFYYRNDKQSILDRLPCNCKNFLLYVSANFNPANREDVKGGYYLVQLAKKLPEFTFVVVSSSFTNVANLPSNIIFWGRAKNQDELASLYSAATLTVLTSRKETFSMVTAESLCCGTPVVGYCAGGPESIAIAEYSKFVLQYNINELVFFIKEFMHRKWDKDEISKKSRGIYSKEKMCEGYYEIYKNLLISK